MSYRKRTLSLILVLNFFLLLSANPLIAQESMLSGVSYLYMEKLIATAKENYPKYKAYSNRIKVAKNNLSEQKSSWLDPFSFSYVFRSNNNNVDLETASILLSGYQFGVSVNPGMILKKPFLIKTAKEEIKISEFERDEYELQLEAEVKRRYIVYLQALNVMKLKTNALIDIESTHKLNKAKYEKNEISFQQYNDSSVALSSAAEAKVTAEGSMAIAKVSLEELLTKKLEEIK